MKALFYGASVASMAGLLLGMALEARIAPTSSYGQQLLISHPTERTPSAFDSWMPTEGAPPAYLAADAAPSGDDVEQALARLTIFGGRAEPVVEPVVLARADTPRDPEPYLPSRRGDILAPADPAPAAYEVAAVDLPYPEPAYWGRDRAPAEEAYRDREDVRYDRYGSYDDVDAPPDPPPYGRAYR